MKLINHLKHFYFVSSLISFCFVSFILFSCSSEEADIDSDVIHKKVETADLKKGIHFETWQDQIDRLTKKTRKFHNFQVAVAQGWGTQVTGQIPGMGIHFLNPELNDGTFEMEKP